MDENFTKYLQIDDDKTVDYNKDTNLDDLETVDYNNDIYLDDLETIGYKSDAEVEPSLAPKTSVVKHQAAKKIIKKYKNLKRKGQPITYAKTNKKISKEAQIAKDNVSALMNKKFVFDPKEILNKTLLFDTSKIDEELIMDKIIHALPPDDYYFYIEHPKGSNSFTLKREDGR